MKTVGGSADPVKTTGAAWAGRGTAAVLRPRADDGSGGRTARV
jgi:hypothetical protein